MSRSTFSVYPRYTAGSPAMVPRDIAVRVARAEAEALPFVLMGYQGERAKREAEMLGLAGIAVERWERGNRVCTRDLITGEVTERRTVT